MVADEPGKCVIQGLHLSIVSHRQGTLVSALLSDIALLASATNMKITIVSNVPESSPAIPGVLTGRIEHLVNERPMGFGANHNQVFRRCEATYFCVLNPDLRLSSDPFPQLLQVFGDDRIALAAPAASDPVGRAQDNARRLPTPWRVASKLWWPATGPDYSSGGEAVFPECIAGFFMLFRSVAFRGVGGFDQRYFLYYEDFDLCCRLRLAGWKVAWLPRVQVMHNARRRSHHDVIHLLYHARSAVRFFGSAVYRAARALPG